MATTKECAWCAAKVNLEPCANNSVNGCQNMICNWIHAASRGDIKCHHAEGVTFNTDESLDQYRGSWKLSFALYCLPCLKNFDDTDNLAGNPGATKANPGIVWKIYQ